MANSTTLDTDVPTNQRRTTLHDARDFVEDSLVEPRPNAVPNDDNDRAVTYRELAGSSKRGRSKLYDSNGYDYVMLRQTSGGKYWRCSLRSVQHKCRVIVIQRGDTFLCGEHRHLHPGKVCYCNHNIIFNKSF